ncbi:MAG: hypothetical protein ACREOI_09685 [bacterium]
MILRSDTIGHFKNPSDHNLEHAFYPQGGTPRYLDIIKLIRSNEEYLAARFIGHECRCQIIHKHKGVQLECLDLFSLDETVEIFKRYLRNDISWTEGYQWKKAFGQLVKESLS